MPRNKILPNSGKKKPSLEASASHHLCSPYISGLLGRRGGLIQTPWPAELLSKRPGQWRVRGVHWESPGLAGRKLCLRKRRAPPLETGCRKQPGWGPSVYADCPSKFHTRSPSRFPLFLSFCLWCRRLSPGAILYTSLSTVSVPEQS